MPNVTGPSAVQLYIADLLARGVKGTGRGLKAGFSQIGPQFGERRPAPIVRAGMPTYKPMGNIVRNTPPVQGPPYEIPAPVMAPRPVTPPPGPAVAQAPAPPVQNFPDPEGDQQVNDMAAAVIGLGTGDERAADAQGDINQGQAWLDTPLPEGRNSGRVYTAANPLEALGAGLKMWQGRKTKKKGEKERARVRGMQDTGREKAIAALLRGRKLPEEAAWGDMGNLE